MEPDWTANLGLKQVGSSAVLEKFLFNYISHLA